MPSHHPLQQQLREVSSSCLSHVAYDAARRDLAVVFRPSGKYYVYHGVPYGVYQSLIVAPSLGVYFNAHIRNVYPHTP